MSDQVIDVPRQRRRGLPEGYYEVWEHLEGEAISAEERAAYERELDERFEAMELASAESRARAYLNETIDGGYIGVLRQDLCAYCGAPCEDLDHIEARSRGGANGWQNLTAACRRCNGQKGAKTLLAFLGARRARRTDRLARRLWAGVAR